ncbi:radical SAM protein [Magnetococcales bacterium HHB-1]
MATLYSSLKFLRFSDHLKAIQNRQVKAPIHIRIKPINRCNHSCWYCAYKADHMQLGEDMVESDVIPQDKMDEIVTDLLAMNVRAVTFSGGGEPLIYKNLSHYVERLALGGIRVAALTNGSNLKGRTAQIFAKHATWIRISIDAWDDESYRKARSIRGDAFTQVMNNMANFSKLSSSCVLGVSYIITQENYPHMFGACKKFKKAGANHIKLSGAIISNDIAENNLYHREISDSVSKEIKKCQSLEDKSFSIINHYHELNERFDKDYTFCPFLQYLTVIGADCQVYSCQDKAYNEKGLLGSIKEQSFQKFWFSEENKTRLYGLNPSTDCHHHCVTHSKNLAILDYLSLDPEHGFFV